MDEVKFVLKSLVVTALILFLLQMKWKNSTIENEALMWIETSSATRYLQNVSSGGVLAIRNASQTVSEYISKAFRPNENETRASKLNFEFKRNPQVSRQQKNQPKPQQQADE